MRRVLIATHGYLADGVKSLLAILGDNHVPIEYVNAYVNDHGLKAQLDAFFELEAEERILFSDLYGGSVNQQLTSYLNIPNTYLITGFNIPLVLEILYASSPISVDKLNELIQVSRNQMKLMNAETLSDEKKEEEFFES